MSKKCRIAQKVLDFGGQNWQKKRLKIILSLPSPYFRVFFCDSLSKDSFLFLWEQEAC